MNYRHAFHAGNFADVLKHILLVRLILRLRAKETPFRLIDTHAGLGWYDLAGEEALRTSEHRAGIEALAAPVDAAAEALLAPFRAILAEIRRRHGGAVYPGSPAIMRALLRPQDRAVLVELHPGDHAVLAARFARAANVKVLQLDGWTALRSLLPPKERRGLVLIDPPYEDRTELDRLARDLARAVAKWPTGIYAAWYPVKDRRAVDTALASLASALARPTLRLELAVAPQAPERLAACGLVIVNPPWQFEDEAERLLPALADRLGGGAGAWRLEGLRRGDRRIGNGE